MHVLLTLLVIVGLAFPGQLLSCPKPVQFMTRNTSTPCDGWLFSEEMHAKILENDINFKVLEELVAIQKQQLSWQEKRLEIREDIAKQEAERAELWRTRAEDSTRKLTEEENNRGKRDWLFLLSGVLLTVAAGFAVGQAGGK